MTDKVAYIGSSNFSDESRHNSECGTIIRNKSIKQEINETLIQMLIENSVPYYSSEYMKVFVRINNLFTQSKVFYEEYYWSFLKTQVIHIGIGEMHIEVLMQNYLQF